MDLAKKHDNESLSTVLDVVVILLFLTRKDNEISRWYSTSIWCQMSLNILYVSFNSGHLNIWDLRDC